ncbi:DUF6884 domain-containing protein [Breoghania sp. JC706]|uniref:DUF6884 domain-containing protein n=1 Tax=Breoghania sp. JC706 TaxID=3117732 RepID=UPI0030094C78
MSVSENIRALAREGLKVAEIARRLGIRYQHAYNVLKQSPAPSSAERECQGKASIDLTNALVLVSCVSQKLIRPAPARLLYRSDWFLKVRSLVESQEADWLILSALHGVVAPDVEIAPYEKTLNAAGVPERRAWAESTFRQLNSHLTGRRRIVMFAGLRYREFLVPALLADGYEVDVPMANLRIGEQLAWLGARS